ncbi:hypothetical protein [Candidatus Nitrosocosmicus sp. T]
MPANNAEQHGPCLDHYAIALPNNNGEIRKLRNNFANLRIDIDKNMTDDDKQYHNNTFYVYDPDGIKIQFLFS